MFIILSEIESVNPFMFIILSEIESINPFMLILIKRNIEILVIAKPA